jgi:chromosome segregation ATPase
MAEKPKSQDELRQIRELLFGDDKRDTNTRVDRLEDAVADVRGTISGVDAALTKKIDTASSGASDDVRALNEEMMSRLTALDQTVADNAAAASDQLNLAVGSLTTELKSLGTQLNETNRKLDEERERREVLASGLRALADAMMAPQTD